ncbi:nonsense-mediated mRNA decay factor SMG5 [Neocloeon triangulifer]|uniref:nonsense-mediated mRNA decay factor SMG5 n=1 Tax=Neocloeon triangulifer TaxID=2078957 RepID=UPI00286F69DA|nr:nonsense-mediated mRNA decay factor SMG5 [Neocloeon triangulifer]
MSSEMKAMSSKMQHTGETLDSCKRFFRGIAEAARQLEEQQSRVANISQLFSTELVAKRAKIVDHAAKLALKEPKVFGKKCEDVFWRKIFYSAYVRAKQLKKSTKIETEDSALIRHLLAGVGFYHSFILKVQAEYQVDVTVDLGITPGMQQLSTDQIKYKNQDSCGLEWAVQALQRSLIALGDLHRYLSTMSPTWSGVQSARFYVLASQVNPKSSMPFNQLGTLASAQGKKFDAAYFYLRCLASESPFEGAEANLRQALKSSTSQLKAGSREQVKVFLAKFLSLIDAWWFNDKIKDINVMFEDCIMEFKANLTLIKPVALSATAAESIENLFKEELETSHFSSELLVKMIAICLMTHHKLEKQHPLQASSMVVFILNILNCVTKKLVNCSAQVVEKKPPAKKKQKVMQRRKKIAGNCSEGSDESDVESNNLSASSSESDSDSVESVASSSDEEEVEKQPILKNQDLPALGCMKICCDWLQTNESVLGIFFANFRPLFDDFVVFLNAVAHDCSLVLENININGSFEEVLKSMEPYPLPEDVALRGHEVVDQSSINWSLFNSSPFKSDMLIRMIKLVSFGIYMTNSTLVGLKFDSETKTFSSVENFIAPKENSKPKKQPPNKDQQKKLMQNMGQLWLQEEVRNLESRVSRSQGNCTFSPYIVVDSSALLTNLHLVKQLVLARKFVVVIPITVLETLDDLKKESAKAREGIRWLESQFQKGNRFLRAQRSNEALSIPLIKCPKKKDKEAWVFFQILECSNYLCQQVSRENQSPNTNLVTLLCGSLESNQKEFSPTGLAASAGVKLETISEFYQKWKSSKKNAG